MLASFLSLRAVGSQLMSTSRPMASAGQQMIRLRPRRVATGNHQGCPFVGRGVFSSRRRMKRANRVRRILITSDRGSEPTVTGRPATHDPSAWLVASHPDRVTVHSGRVIPGPAQHGDP
jgi:hypothetical protein